MGLPIKNLDPSNTGGPNNMWSDVGFSFYNYPEVNNISSLSIRIYAYKGVNSGYGGYMAMIIWWLQPILLFPMLEILPCLMNQIYNSSYYSGGIGQSLNLS